MNVIRNEVNIMIDVDDTLVMHQVDGNYLRQDSVDITDPYSGSQVRLRKNFPMIRCLEEEHARGSHITVWSKGGYAWAEAVIMALGLTNKVHQIMTKPRAYFDDKPVQEWLTDRVYLGPDTFYKK